MHKAHWSWGQQEGKDGGRLTVEARKQGLLCASQPPTSSGCLKTSPNSLPSLGWASPQTMQHFQVYRDIHICYHSGLPQAACRWQRWHSCLCVTLGTQDLERASNSSGSQGWRGQHSPGLDPWHSPSQSHPISFLTIPLAKSGPVAYSCK